MKLVNLTGQRFDRLQVIARTGSDAHGHVRWSCRCDCGSVTVARGDYLQCGKTTSCGCSSGKAFRTLTHGAARHGKEWPEYRCWADMIQRCCNPKHRQFKYWGGRGIKVCTAWRQSFTEFLSDMGRRPEGLSLDRINNDGDYEPENCRWATDIQQNRNQRHRPSINKERRSPRGRETASL